MISTNFMLIHPNFHTTHSFLIPVTSIELPCKFQTNSNSLVGTVYECRIEGEELITDKSNRIITKIAATHDNRHADLDVNSIWIDSCKVFYFPQEIDYFFIKLEKIALTDSGLKELRRDDLAPFPQLRHLDLRDNELQVLEENLFENNPNLEDISLHHNEIAHIEPEVFDNLMGKLRYLYLDHNVCDFENAVEDKRKANEIIAKIQDGSCKDVKKLWEFLGVKSAGGRNLKINFGLLTFLAIFIGKFGNFV